MTGNHDREGEAISRDATWPACMEYRTPSMMDMQIFRVEPVDGLADGALMVQENEY
jgi:hypothetical protein